MREEQADNIHVQAQAELVHITFEQGFYRGGIVLTGDAITGPHVLDVDTPYRRKRIIEERTEGGTVEGMLLLGTKVTVEVVKTDHRSNRPVGVILDNTVLVLGITPRVSTF